MSWQLGAFSLLAVALAGGFWWYERNRPDARIVALVGTLAAFAALGRIAFAPVPNVKPTTDIVFIAGYALGAGPGFAVGALAGLSSNFFFGQGPWTPWQMAAWGATGLIGAGLAALVARRGRSGAARPLGRRSLAVVCGIVGFAFTAVQDVGSWVSYSDHSATQLWAYVGQGLGFDAVHAAGCVAFALALGPALTRSVQRFARRLHVTWLDDGTGAPAGPVVGILLALVAAFMFAAAGSTPARAATSPVVSRAVGYLLGAENADGGFGEAPGQPSDPLYSGWAALGLASTGDPLAAVHGGGLLAYVRAGAAHPSDVGAVERTMLVAAASGMSSRAFGGQDLVAALERHIGANGSVSGQVNWTAFAVLALRGAGVPVSHRTLAWLVAQQNRDGGFSFAGAGGGSDVDDTGAALEALAADPGARKVRARAMNYLLHQQDADGGFPSQPGSGSNAQSTAWAIQGLEAAGLSPAALPQRGNHSPLNYLASLALPNGAIRYARGNIQTPVWVTGEALMALAGRPLPIIAPALPAARAPAAAARRRPASHRGASGSRPASRAVRTATHVRPAAHPTRRRPAGRSGDTAPGGPVGTAEASHLAADVGVLTAVVLAPIGLG